MRNATLPIHRADLSSTHHAVRKLFEGSAVTRLGDREIRVICSSGSVDRSGDVVVQEGIDLTNYRRNPVVLYGHDQFLPVGRCIQIGVVGGRLQATIMFAPLGASLKADEICALMKCGVLSAVSIGFDPIVAVPLDPARPRGPQKYLRTELLELSACAVPAQADALVIERHAVTSMQLMARDKRERQVSILELAARKAELRPASARQLRLQAVEQLR